MKVSDDSQIFSESHPTVKILDHCNPNTLKSTKCGSLPLFCLYLLICASYACFLGAGFTVPFCCWHYSERRRKQGQQGASLAP